MEFINFGEIKQFRHVISEIKRKTYYIGKDSDDNDILDYSKQLPIVKALGSEKIHGTNASVCYTKETSETENDIFWVQSRNNIISLENDNAECVKYVLKNKKEWLKIIDDLAIHHSVDLNDNIIVIYYEWCGGNIQSKSCVSGLQKMAILFRYFKVVNKNTKTSTKLETRIKDTWIDNKNVDVYNIMNFPTYQIEIDFENTDEAYNKMTELTLNIEQHSGVANYFGKSENIGEGIVWTFHHENIEYKWKTKGDKHSQSNVKAVKTQNTNPKITEFINKYAITESRLEQFWQNTFRTNEPSIKLLGTFLKNYNKDVLKEESDILKEFNLDMKTTSSEINKIAKSWFIKKLNSC